MSALTNGKTALVAGAAMIGAAAAAYLLWGRGKESAGGDDELTVEETRALLQELASKIAENARRMMQATEGIKAQLQGQVDDHTILKTFILPHFETAIRTATTELLAPYDIDEEEFEAACQKYADDEEVTKHVKNIKLLYTSLGGDVAEELSPELAEQAVDIAVEFYTVLTESFVAMEGRLAQAIQMVQNPQEISEILQQVVFQMSSQAQDAIMQKYGVTESELNAMVTKVAQDPEVMEANENFVAVQKEFLAQLGIGFAP